MNTAPNNPNAPQGDRDQVIKGHNYDGIKEYDNPMPGRWVGIFWVCVAFAIFYIPAVHVFDWVDTYEEDLAQSQAELQLIRDNYAAANPTFTVDEASLEAYVGQAAAIEAGATIYAANCAACHGQAGEGLIGPNLTDDYWIHGATNVAMFNVITDGVLEKGMTPWGGILSPEQRAETIAFLRSIHGTNPEGAKAPQGELVEL